MNQAEKRLMHALAKLLQQVASGTVHSQSAALCIENALAGLETKLPRQQGSLFSKDNSADLGISVRARKALYALGAMTVDDVASFSADDLRSRKNVGYETVTEVRSFLQRHNLKLRGE